MCAQFMSVSNARASTCVYSILCDTSLKFKIYVHALADVIVAGIFDYAKRFVAKNSKKIPKLGPTIT